MTAIAKTDDWISPEEYLEGELYSQIRREYVDGRVFAMAGASDNHNRIAFDLGAELRAGLRGSRCEPFMNDMKVRIPDAANAYYYPDVLVCCDRSDNAKYYRERPSYIFEVLSPETERVDRGEKMLAYRQIPGIKGYVILEQDRIQAAVMTPAASGWNTEVLRGPEAILRLHGLQVEIPLARIYERTAVAPEVSRTERDV